MSKQLNYSKENRRSQASKSFVDTTISKGIARAFSASVRKPLSRDELRLQLAAAVRTTAEMGNNK